jgi:hypothetical protein
MTETGPAPGQLERWIRSGASIVAPATALSALLFYFGYVSARSRYVYFGVDVDTIGLSTQDYIMRSPQPLLVPLVVFTLAGVGGLALRAMTHKRVAKAAEGRAYTPQIQRIRRVGRGSVYAGIIVLGAGIILLLGYALMSEWALYPLVTPLVIGLGALLIIYGSHVQKLLHRLLAKESADAKAAGNPAPLRRSFGVLIYILVAASAFWLTATVAVWSGLGLAQQEAQKLENLPSVILDTKERLFLRNQNVDETILTPESQGQTFHYRYRRLRLLIHNQDRMFLVPDRWSASNSTLLVQLDGSVRVQFQFQNQQP